MIRLSRMVAAVVVMVVSNVALADPPPPPPQEALAQQYAERGNALYAEQRYADALVQFDLARRTQPNPFYDLSVARCYDAMNRIGSAIANYSRFLRGAPDSPEAPEVKRRMKTLKAMVKAQARAEAAPPEADETEEGDEEETPASPAARRRAPPRHVFGFGTSLSGGYYAIQSGSVGGSTPTLVFWDLDLLLAVSPGFELDLWLPLLNMFAFNGVSTGTVLWMDLFFKIYPGGEGAGFFVAPGVGAWYIGTPSGASGVIAEIPFRIGYEFGIKSRVFGFSIGGRPWIDFLFASEGRTAFGYGLLVEMGFHLYITR